MNKYVEYLMNRWIQGKYRPTAGGEGKPKAILAICRQPLGDTVLASPLLKGLRQAYPNHHFTLVCSPENFNLVELCPYADEVLPYGSEVQGSYLRGHFHKALAFAKEHFAAYDYELAVIPSTGMPSLPEAWLAYFSGADRRFSYSEKFNPQMHKEFMGMYDNFFTVVHHDEKVEHEVERNTEIFELLELPKAEDKLELWTDDKDIAASRKIWQEKQVPDEKIKLLVNLSTSCPVKDWPVERYIEVCERLRSQYDISFILIGAGKTARSYGDTFLKKLPEAYDFINQTTIRQTIALMQGSDMYLGGDTGPAHFASACHLRGVVIYGVARDIKSTFENSVLRLSPWQASMKVVQPDNALPGCEYGCKAEKPHCIAQVGTDTVYHCLAEMISEGM